MSRNKPAQSIGEVQRLLEAADEHMAHVWGALRRAGMVTEDEYYHPGPTTTEGRKVGSAEYHLAAAGNYMRRCMEGMYEWAGGTDGQLCPYEECAHDLAFDGEGFWRCPNCGGILRVDDTDSDFEDYHTSEVDAQDVPPTANIRFARDLGPSWATPEKEESHE